VKPTFTIEQIKKASEKAGIDFFGSVRLEKEPSFEHFEKWISENKHGEMGFLERYKEFREDPSKLEPEFSKALIFGLNYYQGDKYSGPNSVNVSRVAQYARFRDYHKLLKKKADGIMEELFADHVDAKKSYRVLIDSAPVLERALATKSGNGFIGKNTVFIHPKKGSYFLLFEVLVDTELEISDSVRVDSNVRSEYGGCGSCKRCKVHCPSGALTKDFVLDARKCISYYTIEHRGVIPIEYWQYLKLYYFGCDICQLVCPYNRNAKISSEIKSKIDLNKDMYDVALMNQSEYENWFGGTPMTRAKISGLKRNALINLVVNNDSRLGEVIQKMSGFSEVIDLTISQIPEYQKS
jgi:epoxyqueuosine reductase